MSRTSSDTDQPEGLSWYPVLTEPVFYTGLTFDNSGRFQAIRLSERCQLAASPMTFKAKACSKALSTNEA